jgi:hypothetical protein
MIETEISPDAKDPSPEVSGIATFLESRIRSDEGVLDEVETSVVIETHSADVAIDE